MLAGLFLCVVVVLFGFALFAFVMFCSCVVFVLSCSFLFLFLRVLFESQLLLSRGVRGSIWCPFLRSREGAGALPEASRRGPGGGPEPLGDF